MKNKAIILALLVVVIVSGTIAGCGSSSTTPVQVALLYSVGQGSNSINGFKILSSGELVPQAISSFSTNPRPVAMALHPSKNFIYVASFTANTVSGFNLDRTTGVLTPVGTALPPTPVGTAPVGLGVNSTGQFLFVLNQGSASITVFSIDAARGLLTEISGSPFPTLANPQFLVVSPTSGALYVANGTLSTISGFTIGTSGALTPIAGSPFSAGAGANVAGMTIDPKGLFLFATDSANNKVVSFSIASGTGALSPVAGSPFSAGTKPVNVAVDSTGTFLYASNSGSDDVSAFKVSSGALTPVAGSPFTTKGAGATTAAQPGFVTVDVTNTFLYVANINARSIAAFGINSADGTLVPVNNQPFFENISPQWIITTK